MKVAFTREYIEVMDKCSSSTIQKRSKPHVNVSLYRKIWNIMHASVTYR